MLEQLYVEVVRKFLLYKMLLKTEHYICFQKLFQVLFYKIIFLKLCVEENTIHYVYNINYTSHSFA